MDIQVTEPARRRRLLAIPALAALTTAAFAVPSGAASTAEVTAEEARLEAEAERDALPRMVEEAVKTPAIRAHQRALQDIADANGGTRASGTPGYDQSAAYVARVAREAGYEVTLQEFEFRTFEELSPAEFEQAAPNRVTYETVSVDEETGEVVGDFATLEYSGSGDVTAAATPVDVNLTGDRASDSGCSTDLDGVTPEDDFAGFPAGNVAIVQRGTCTFQEKVENAQAAGASAVVIFNQGNDPGRVDVFVGTLSQTTTSTVPAVSTSFDLGATLVGLADDGLRLRVATDTLIEAATTTNVLADHPIGRDDNVVVVGAHLDSVFEGPGINDNGSGTAAILETAVQLAKFQPNNKVRFAFWGAEESGLNGSNYYVANLPPEELATIALYLNFDMVGSPNYVRFVYDGDGSAFGLAGPEGSDYIERFYARRHFGRRGLASEPTEFSGRSDYQAFILAGIPAGGLFTGAEGIKTPQQARIYGGTAGVAYDPCYHQACDTYANVSVKGLNEMANAIAHSVAEFSRRTTEVNGVRNNSASAMNAVLAGSGMEYLGPHLAR